jgi:hypothetical protein
MKSITELFRHFKKVSAKKAEVNLGDMPGIVLVLAVVVITISMIATVLSDMQGSQVAASIAYNATGKGLESMNTLAEWTPTIALVIAAALILGIILTAFAVRKNNM